MADADDMTATTDAGGLYAFAGLAAGDYTVGIAVESEAYVFETMSMDVTVGDDETAIVNFEGAHARTASVSGMLFIDELMKNDMHDEGEHPLPHAGVPVVLVGPGVNDQVPMATDSTGAYSFMGLRAGNYQLVVPVTEPMGDFAYGGDPTGYALEVGVGEAVTQNLPIDITHTTVHFGVTLKAGEQRGMPLPGAMVTLYADEDGEDKVGEGTTMVNEETMHAVASIRVARAGTSGNTVHAGVAAEGYDVAAGMTAVMWDPQKTYTQGANDNDIVNLNVDLTFSGATITTEYGGGDELAGWAVSVGHGDAMTADTLDDDGMAAFKMTLDSAGALPAMFTFSVDTIQDNKLDGGENFEGTSVEYVHTGLALAGDMPVDAGEIEVQYTTQTLKVYVHHEMDQVMGYTGNILDGDERDNGKVSVGIRYIDGNGRSRAFPSSAKITSPRGNGAKGVWTFSNVPADHNVIAQVSDAQHKDSAGYVPIMLLDPDELAAYTSMETNGVTGGAFGAMGGFSHTVELCPLQAVDPTGQDHGECASFAYVSTHLVKGLIWKNQVLRGDDNANDDSFEMGPKDDGGPTFLPGISVSLDPVDGKNLAGEPESATTTAKPVRTPGENAAGTNILDETHQFNFGRIAAGVYKLSLTDGWRARLGEKDTETMVGNALNPLAGDIELDITPTTTTVYGYVRDSDGFPVEDVTVTVNGVEATSDVHGRYIAEYVPSATRTIRGQNNNRPIANNVFVETAHEGNVKTLNYQGFAANSRIQQDVELSGVGKTASVSGTVTASGSGAPIAGAEIKVDNAAPSNAATSGVNKGKLVTGADGTYTATFKAKELGETVSVSVSKAGMSFAPASLSGLPAHAGSAVSGIDFTGFLHARISGRVKDPAGKAMPGVTVTATNTIAGAAGDNAESTTNARGTFVLSVPFGSYTIAASKKNYTFSYPVQGQTRSVAPGQALDFGDIQAMTFAASGVAAARLFTADDEATDVDESERYDGNVRVAWKAGTVPDGHTVTYQVQTKVGDADWANLGTEVTSTALAADTPTDSTARREAIPADSDGGFMVRVVSVTDNGGGGATPDTINSDPVEVGAVDPSASGVSARRQAAGDSDEAAAGGDFIQASWSATTNGGSSFRVVAEVTAANAGGNTVWVVLAAGADANARSAVSPEIGDDYAGPLTIALPSGTGASVAVTAAELRAAIKIAVESVQGTADATDDGPKWKRSAAVDLAARTDG